MARDKKQEVVEVAQPERRRSRSRGKGNGETFAVRLPRELLVRIENVKPQIKAAIGIAPTKYNELVMYLLNHALKELEKTSKPGPSPLPSGRSTPVI
jgi:hypothetical protein